MSTTITKGTMGTLAFMAPEVIDKQVHSKSSDIFALGITMWMLITKQTRIEHLYPNVNQEAEILNEVKTGKRPPVTKEFKIGYETAMRRCWSTNEQKRPTIQELLSIVESNFGTQRKHLYY
jgi:serine/threonine protein kinase